MSTAVVLSVPVYSRPAPVPATANVPAFALPDSTLLGYAAALAGCYAAFRDKTPRAKIASIKLCRVLLPDLNLKECKDFVEWVTQGTFSGPNGEWVRPTTAPPEWVLI